MNKKQKLNPADMVVVNDPINYGQIKGFVVRALKHLTQVHITSSTLTKYQETSNYFFPPEWVEPIPVATNDENVNRA